MKNLLCLALGTAVVGFVLLVACDRLSDNPVESILPNQSEVVAIEKPGTDGPSANGQAQMIFMGEKQTFAFHAREFKDGTVEGSFETKNLAYPLRMHGSINCLNVSGKVAIMSGTIIQVTMSDWDFLVGWDIWFKVVDNGEGQNEPDEWSDLYLFYDLADCNSPQPYPFEAGLIPIEAGNVQVKP
ncbi:MAG TPA: hypothetical protein VGD14_18000 [bacterium]